MEQTCFDERLIRWAPNAWAWSDGVPEDRVTDMTASWCYKFRVGAYQGRQFIEVPVTTARKNLDLEWVDTGGYATHRSQARRWLGHEVYLVPYRDWQEHDVCIGAKWDKADQADIKARARDLGWMG